MQGSKDALKRLQSASMHVIAPGGTACAGLSAQIPAEPACQVLKLSQTH